MFVIWLIPAPPSSAPWTTCALKAGAGCSRPCHCRFWKAIYRKELPIGSRTVWLGRLRAPPMFLEKILLLSLFLGKVSSHRTAHWP